MTDERGPTIEVTHITGGKLTLAVSQVSDCKDRITGEHGASVSVFSGHTVLVRESPAEVNALLAKARDPKRAKLVRQEAELLEMLQEAIYGESTPFSLVQLSIMHTQSGMGDSAVPWYWDSPGGCRKACPSNLYAKMRTISRKIIALDAEPSPELVALEKKREAKREALQNAIDALTPRIGQVVDDHNRRGEIDKTIIVWLMRAIPSDQASYYFVTSCKAGEQVRRIDLTAANELLDDLTAEITEAEAK